MTVRLFEVVVHVLSRVIGRDEDDLEVRRLGNVLWLKLDFSNYTCNRMVVVGRGPLAHLILFSVMFWIRVMYFGLEFCSYPFLFPSKETVRQDRDKLLFDLSQFYNNIIFY